MSNLRYSTWFWICFDFRTYHSSEYTRVFWICRVYTSFWIKYFVIDVRQYSEYVLDSEYCHSSKYARVTNLWITFSIIDIWHVIHVWQVSENSLGSQYVKYTRVVNIRRLHMVLCKLHFKDSQYRMSRVLIMLRFWMYQEFKYAILNSFEKNTSSYIFESEYLGFWLCQVSLRKRCIV